MGNVLDLHEVPGWQLNCLISLASFSVAALGVLLPGFLFRSDEGDPKYNLGLSIGNMLSSGVMLSAALVHLLAESFEELNRAFSTSQEDKHYPWAMVLCGVGFIITLFAAQLLEPGSGESRCKNCQAGCKAQSNIANVSPAAAILTKGLSGNFEHHTWHDMVLDHSYCEHSHGSNGHVHDHAEAEVGHQARHEQSDMITIPESEQLQAPLLTDSPPSEVGSFVLATGLAIHACIEGAAIGAQTNPAQTINVAVAVLAHKGLTAYAVGSSLYTTKIRGTQFLAYLLVFSLSTPLGIFIGQLLSTELKGDAWSAAISAVASGTFMYSSVVEVLGNELRLDTYELDSIHRTTIAKVAKLVAFIIGFASMCLVSMFT